MGLGEMEQWWFDGLGGRVARPHILPAPTFQPLEDVAGEVLVFYYFA